MTNDRHGCGGGLHIVAAPTSILDLGRVVGRPELTGFKTNKLVARFPGGGEFPCHHATNISQWRPGLRRIYAEGDTPNKSRYGSYQLDTNGTCEAYILFSTNDQHPGVFIGQLVAALGGMLSWVETVRNAADDIAGEFTVAVQMEIYGQPALLVEYGTTQFSEARGVTLPVGLHVFPVMSVAGAEEFNLHLQRFDEDIWNLAGHDIHHRIAPSFELLR